MSVVTYKGEQYESTSPTRPSSWAEKSLMKKHWDKDGCTGTTMIQLRDAGIIFDVYICETCKKEL